MNRKSKIMSSDNIIEKFKLFLLSEEKSAATVDKYVRDASAFFDYADGREITKELVVSYKNALREKGYKERSINSVLASLNSLFSFLDRSDLKVKMLKIQQQVFYPEEKELTKDEYYRLLSAADAELDGRLYLIILTICGTGIRVSELRFITVEAVKNGLAVVSCKGKTRYVFIVSQLQKKLTDYASVRGIGSGCIFTTKNGNPISRTNIWRDMKRLSAKAGVNEKKVFPHNLRHLFARVFYNMEKDIAELADILGHSNINTTRIYIANSGSEYRRKMEKMNLII